MKKYLLKGMICAVIYNEETGEYITNIWNDTGTFLIELPTRSRVGDILRIYVYIESLKVEAEDLLIFKCKRT